MKAARDSTELKVLVSKIMNIVFYGEDDDDDDDDAVCFPGVTLLRRPGTGLN